VSKLAVIGHEVNDASDADGAAVGEAGELVGAAVPEGVAPAVAEVVGASVDPPHAVRSTAQASVAAIGRPRVMSCFPRYVV
jgi:hypothetical protein